MRDQWVVAVDVDKTLAPYNGMLGLRPLPPFPGAKEFLTNLKALGCYIIIHTCRVNFAISDELEEEMLIELENWLSDHKLPWDEIWRREGKPNADFFVDDKAVGCNRQENYLAYTIAELAIEARISKAGSKADVDSDIMIYQFSNDPPGYRQHKHFEQEKGGILQ